MQNETNQKKEGLDLSQETSSSPNLENSTNNNNQLPLYSVLPCDKAFGIFENKQTGEIRFAIFGLASGEGKPNERDGWVMTSELAYNESIKFYNTETNEYKVYKDGFSPPSNENWLNASAADFVPPKILPADPFLVELNNLNTQAGEENAVSTSCPFGADKSNDIEMMIFVNKNTGTMKLQALNSVDRSEWHAYSFNGAAPAVFKQESSVPLILVENSRTGEVTAVAANTNLDDEFQLVTETSFVSSTSPLSISTLIDELLTPSAYDPLSHSGIGVQTIVANEPVEIEEEKGAKNKETDNNSIHSNDVLTFNDVFEFEDDVTHSINDFILLTSPVLDLSILESTKLEGPKDDYAPAFVAPLLSPDDFSKLDIV